MTQTVFINATMDTTTQADRANYRHTVTRGTKAGQDITVSLDPTKVLSVNTLKSALDQVYRAFLAGADVNQNIEGGAGAPSRFAAPFRGPPQRGGLSFTQVPASRQYQISEMHSQAPPYSTSNWQFAFSHFTTNTTYTLGNTNGELAYIQPSAGIVNGAIIDGVSVSFNSTKANVTFTSGSTHVGWPSHGLSVNSVVNFYGSATFPTNVTSGTSFYVGTVIDANTITLSTTPNNANPVTPGGSPTGTFVGLAYGTWNQLTFGGAAGWTVDTTAGRLSDVLSVSVPAGAPVMVRTLYHYPYPATVVSFPNDGSNNIVWTNHNAVLNEGVSFSVTGGSLPTGITAGTTYFVQAVVDANTLRIATTQNAGSPSTLTGAGTGTMTGYHYYLLGSFVPAIRAGEICVGNGTQVFTGCLTGSPITITTAGTTQAIGPTFSIAQGGDGRPVWLVMGDSIGAGNNEVETACYVNDQTNITTWKANPAVILGHIGRGLWDNTSGNRYAFSNFCTPSQNGYDWAANGQFAKRLALLALCPNIPFTEIYNEHIVNFHNSVVINYTSGTPVGSKSAWFTSYMPWLVGPTGNWPGLPLYCSKSTPYGAGTTDFVQTVANQSQSNNYSTYIGYTPGTPLLSQGNYDNTKIFYDYDFDISDTAGIGLKANGGLINGFVSTWSILADATHPDRWIPATCAGTLNASYTSGTTLVVNMDRPPIAGEPIQVNVSNSTVTFTNSSTSVTWTGHPFQVNSVLFLNTTGTLPTPYAVNTMYFVVSVIDANTVTLSTSQGGSAITANTTGQSGTHTGYNSTVDSYVQSYTGTNPYTVTMTQGLVSGAASNSAAVVFGYYAFLTAGYTSNATTITVDRLPLQKGCNVRAGTLTNFSQVLDYSPATVGPFTLTLSGTLQNTTAPVGTIVTETPCDANLIHPSGKSHAAAAQAIINWKNAVVPSFAAFYMIADSWENLTNDNLTSAVTTILGLVQAAS